MALLALAACATAPARSPQKGVIRIAVHSPLSGGQAALGEGLKLGAQLAIEQLKGPIERAGFGVELAAFDDQAKPEVGVANAKNIIADPKILLVIGHLNSNVAIQAADVYREARLAMISPANTDPVITDRNYPNVSRLCGRDDMQGAVGATFAREALKVTTAYVIHDKTTYGQAAAEFFAETAKGLAINVVGFEGTEEKSNFDPLIARIKAQNPELVYFGGIYDQAAWFFRQARESGVTSRFLGPDGMDSPDLTKIAGKAVVGMHYTAVAGPVTDYPKAKKFAETFRKKFGKEPEVFAPHAYDATAIGLKAIEAAIAQAGGKMPSRESVGVAVRKAKSSGLTATVEFDEKGDLRRAPYFVRQVVSEDPARWGENKVVSRLELPPPPVRMRTGLP